MHAYIYANSQISTDEFLGYGVQYISIFQSQCANMKFSDQRKYNRMFQPVVHKEEKSAIKYIKVFQKTKALEISVVHSYTQNHMTIRG